MSDAPAERPAAIVVDDDPIIQCVCSRTLEKLGMDVFVVTNGEGAAALAPAHSRRVTLLLVDVELKSLDGTRTDGTQLLITLKPLFPYAMAVQMTAYMIDELRDRGYKQMNPDAILQKPFSPVELRRFVQAVVSLPSR